MGHVNVAIFHEDWVWEQVKESPRPAEAYLTSVKRSAENGSLYYGDYAALTQESSELMYQRLFSNSLVVEEVMFLTALRIGLQVAHSTGSKEIYFVGFDFSLHRGFSRKVDPRASGDSEQKQQHRIELQEQVFHTARKLVPEDSLRLLHVGYKPFSDLTPGAFSERMLNPTRLESEGIERRDRVLITAEITTNHLGDLERAKSMMFHAAHQGADLVKFQMRNVDTFYHPDVLDGVYPSPFGNTFREYRHGLELTDTQFQEIAKYSEELGIGWFASVLDEPSLERAIQLDMPMIKLPGTISRRREFLSKVAQRYPGELVFSTGMTSPEYLEWLLSTFGQERRMYILHTNSAYPTPLDDCNVSVVSSYARLAEGAPHIVPGYSSHDEGWLGSALAVACGARMIEKHVKLGFVDWIHFDSVAVDLATDAFSDFVRAIRRSECALGSADKQLTPSEHHKY